MKATFIEILYYYDLPLLLFCSDEQMDNYFFALFNEDPWEYIGKKVSIDDAIEVLEGKKELRYIYENPSTPFYLGKYDKNGFYFDQYTGAYCEDLLPGHGFILNPNMDLIEVIKKMENKKPRFTKGDTVYYFDDFNNEMCSAVRYVMYNRDYFEYKLENNDVLTESELMSISEFYELPPRDEL